MATVARGGRARTHSIGAVASIAMIKPRPPSEPKSSYLSDITNGAAGLLNPLGKVGASGDAEVTRLSNRIQELNTQLQARDADIHRLEGALELAKREAVNVRSLIASGAPAAAQEAAAAPAAAPATNRARVAAPAPSASAGSPMRKDVMLRVLSSALREADELTKVRGDELAAARAMLAHRSRGPSPGLGGGSDAPAPGVVARLQAELAEAAEERRSLRQQLNALKSKLTAAQADLSDRSGQLSESEKHREQLSQQLSQASGSSSDEHRRLLAELRAAQSSANGAEGRALDLERRLEVSQARASELQGQLNGAKADLQGQRGSHASAAEEASELRARLEAAHEQLTRQRREADEGGQRARELAERAERAEAAAREHLQELQRAKQAAQRASQQAGAESSAECLRLQQELREAQRLAALAEESAASAGAAAVSAAQAKAREEAHAGREQMRALERELRAQIQRLEERLAAAEARAHEADGGMRSAQERAEALALAHAAAEAKASEAVLRGGQQQAQQAQLAADHGKALNELRYAQRGKDKEIDGLKAEMAKMRERHNKEVAAAAEHGRALAKDEAQRADKAAAELKECRATLAKALNDLKEASRESSAKDAELRSARGQAAKQLQGGASAAEDARRLAEREAASRAQAEKLLKETKAMLEQQQRKHDDQIQQMRRARETAANALGGAPSAARAAAGGGGSASGSASGEEEELRKKLQEALEKLAALQDEYDKKKEAWRISSLKRHAETNKLEQALKVTQANEALLKKKADMLELTVLSHQKSMDKGRANIVKEQLKEHNERLEAQSQTKDLHANATQRKTFQETFARQMDALDGKLSKLK